MRLWQVALLPCHVELSEGVLYVLAPGRLVALDAQGGARRWETAVPTDRPDGCDYRPLMAVTPRSIAIAHGDRLDLFDPRSGALQHTVALGAGAVALVGSPLAVIASDGRDGSWVLGVDAEAGTVGARRHLEAGPRQVDGAGDTIVASLPSPGRPRVVGLAHPGLQDRWTREGFDQIARIGGVLHVGRAAGEGGCDAQYWPVRDVTTGTLGRARPTRQPCECQSEVGSDLPWELQYAAWASCNVLRRHSETTGRTLWTAVLPDAPAAVARASGSLFVHTRPEWGRGDLLALEWQTGHVQRAAYGLRGVSRLFAVGETLIVIGGDGVTAVSARRFGPSEATTIPARDAVELIFSRPRDNDAFGELKAIGDAGLPIVSAMLPALDESHLVLALWLVSQREHRGAGPAVAARLRASLAASGKEAEASQVKLTSTLGHVGGPEDVDLLGSLLADTARPQALRGAALQALAGIGTPAAGQVVDRVLARPGDRRLRWEWPSPEGFLDLIGKPLDQAAYDAAGGDESLDEFERLGRGVSSARLPLGEGRSLVVFKSRFLGEGDLWVSEVNAAGQAGPGRFLGARLPGDECYHQCRFALRLAGSVLDVERTDEAAGSVKVDLTDVDRDRDGDGLSDLVEARLGTDPGVADSDGDGLSDSEDPNPDRPPRSPLGEEQEIAGAVFEQVMTFEDRSPGLLLVASDFAVDWFGRRGPTLTRPVEAAYRFLEEGGRGIPLFSVGPVTDSMFPHRPLGPDERDYAYSLGAVSHRIIVRKLGHHWLIRDTYRSVVR